MKDYVVLVNDQNEVLGTSEKLATHHAQTPLHRGFSVFLFNQNGELLLQQRGSKKKTWPLIWSNTCCGHPMLDETSIDAGKRRLAFELGITDTKLFEVLPDYKYCYERNGVAENELCPVMIGFTAQKPTINSNEVEAVLWIPWDTWLNEVNNNPQGYSEWCVEETKLLNENKQFYRLFHEATKKLASR